MKNSKNFDYDKKRPSFSKKYVMQTESDTNNSDYNKMFNEPPLIKGITSTQESKPKKTTKTSKSVSKTSLLNNKNKIKITSNLKPESTSKDKETNIEDTKSVNTMKINNEIGVQIGLEEEDDEKKDLDIIIPSLPDDEIIEPEEPLPEEGKMPNPSFCKKYVSNLLNPSKEEIDPNILSGVEIGLNKVLLSVQEDLEDNKIIVGQEPINNDDFQKFRQNSNSILLPNPNFESSIRMQKIKELNQSKKKLEKQINQLSNKINMLEDENTTGILGDIDYPNSVIEENIKKDKIKDNKQTKELLLAKLNGINEQVQRLVESEEDLNKNKKLNVKEFLENFNKDKEKSEELVKKLTEDKKIREQKMMNSIKKSYDLKQKEYEQMKIDEEEKKKKELEKIRLRELEIIRERNRENNNKLSFIKLHANDKPMNMSQYLFKALENKYNEKQENEIKSEILKKREKMKENSVSLEEIFDFEKKQKELELKRLLEMEEEKKKLKEQWKQTKDTLPKFESNMMQMIKEEEKKNKEKKELEEAKKKLKQQEIKNYSESVNKLYLPKINLSMKKEREERIKNLDVKSNIQHITKKKNTGRIILKKPDPNKPSKYSWKLKLELDEQEKTNKNQNKNQKQLKRSKSAQKHEPLEKLPDYLTEMRLKNTQIIENKSQNKNRGNNWDKMLKNEKGNFIENVEKAKKRVEQLEEKAKMSEKLMQNSSGGIDPDLQQKVSGYLLDAIKGKLSILEKMNQQ